MKALDLKILMSSLLSISVSSPAWSQDKLKVGFIPFEPLVRSNSSEPGLVVEVMKSGLESMGIPYEIRVLPPNRMWSQVNAGKIDVYGGCATNRYTGKMKELYTISEPYLDMTASLFYSPDLGTISSIESLKNLSIVAVAGTESFISSLDKSNQVTFVPETAAVVRVFNAGRAQVIADYRERIIPFIEKMGGNTAFRHFDVFSVPLHICWNAKDPEAVSKGKKLRDYFVSFVNSDKGKLLRSKYKADVRFEKSESSTK